MFHFIKGYLDEVGNDYVVIDVNGVGYRIHTSAKSINRLSNAEDKVKMFTHLHVKEDGMTLYGFFSREELKSFMLLLSVSGIGPKVALGILSHLEIHQLALAVIGDDVKSLTACPGVGNKTAQRIILELRDKINSEEATLEKTGQVVFEDNSTKDALNALLVLGYNQTDAARAISQANKEKQGQSTQQLIKLALKLLDNK